MKLLLTTCKFSIRAVNVKTFLNKFFLLLLIIFVFDITLNHSFTNILPIFESSDIKTQHHELVYTNITAVTCSAVSSVTADIKTGIHLKWSSSDPPYTSPLLICGLVEHSVENCSSPFAEISITFLDVISGNVYETTNSSKRIPGWVCINFSVCQLWDAFREHGFRGSLADILIHIHLEASGVSSVKQRLGIAIKGTAIYDTRKSTTAKTIFPMYQTPRKGALLYTVPWNQCQIEGKFPETTKNSCAPFIEVVPGYSSLYRRFVITLPIDNVPYPLCNPLPSPYRSYSPDELNNQFKAGAMNAAELFLLHEEEALYGVSDVLVAPSYY